MKKIAVIIIVLIAFKSFCQYKKLPITTGYYWHERLISQSSQYNQYIQDYQYEVKSDTVINSVTYNRIYTSFSQISTTTTASSCGMLPTNAYLRQDTVAKKIIILINNSQEYILYNFNKNVNDTVNVYEYLVGVKTLTVMAKDSVLLNDGYYHKRFNYGNKTAIEGVGGLNGLLVPYSSAPTYSNYPICIWNNGLMCFGKINSPPTYSATTAYNCNLANAINSLNITNNELKIYPNPANDILNVEFVTLSGVEANRDASIQIINALGQIMQEEELTFTHHQSSINIQHLKSGIYFVTIIANGSNQTFKFIKN